MQVHPVANAAASNRPLSEGPPSFEVEITGAGYAPILPESRWQVYNL